MSAAIPQNEAPEPLDMTQWALAALADPADRALPPPPYHERLTHLADVLNLGQPGYVYLAVFYGLWRSADLHAPVTAAQAREATGYPPAELRNILIWWDILKETPIAPGTPVALGLTECIGDWLDGGDPIPPRWRDRISHRTAPDPLPHWPMQDLLARAETAMSAGQPRPLVITCCGPAGSGRRSLAAAVCAGLGTTGFEVDLRDLPAPETLALVRMAERAALLSLRPPVYIGGADVIVPEGQPGFSLQFVIADADGAGLSPRAGAPHRCDLGPLAHADRFAVWQSLCPGFADWPAQDQHHLCALKPATVGDIARAAARHPGSAADALAAIREAQIDRLDATILPIRGALGWDDLILPERLHCALRRLSAEMTVSPSLWDDPATSRLFPRGRGVFALFSGYSGTGKTMAAQVIAADLGVDLYVVDTGSIVSKYVGETAQNLQNVFAQAEHDAAVLFFDEADGLFGKRTETRDAHARYLNADTNVLLRAVESFSGCCILATNRRDNIDTAFLRRLRTVLEFPRPDMALRLRLWTQLTHTLGQPDCDLAPTCRRLAEMLEFTGSQIKNAIRTALVEARRDKRRSLVPGDLLTGADQELLKEGRALTPAETVRLSGAAP